MIVWDIAFGNEKRQLGMSFFHFYFDNKSNWYKDMKYILMNSKTQWLLLFVMFLCMPIGTAFAAKTQATYYVSPSGNDSNPGTEIEPFRTVTKARNVVRTLNGSMTGDIVVYLRGGTYPLTNTISFGSSDGGSNGYYVRYVNYSGETPLLTGGQPITGWSVCDQAKNIWCASGVSSRFRQLYVNGTKAVRARFPNVGTNGSANFYRLTKVDTTGRALDVASSYVSNWNNFTKVEMHLMIAWADATLRLASYTTSGTTSKLKIQDPEGTMLFNRPYPMLGVTFGDKTKQQCFYFENAYEFLDQAGEWYLDESSDIVYYMPRAGETMGTATVVAPILENLVTVTGSSTSQKVGYLSFQGLIFAHSSFMRPSKTGFLDLQAGQFNVAAPGGNKYMLWRPAAGITVTNAHHIRFERNVFAQMGGSGLDFISGTNDDMIIGNVFSDIGATGITVGKFAQDSTTEIHIAYNPSDTNEICTRDTIKNNFVTKVTTENQGAVGIGAGYPRYIDIEHNEVSYTNYSGISVGFGWTKNANAMTGNKINWNNIHHVSQLLADAGSIYTLSNQGSGSEIQYNYMHDISASQWADYWINGIYLDEGSSGFDVSHNVFVSAPSGVACNSCGTYTSSDNAGTSATTIANAGIESAYTDIKNYLPIPLPDFSEAIPQAPYKALSIPGLIQMEDYDEGGAGVAYYDSDSENSGGAYRADDGVDIDTADASGTYALGWLIAGEWTEYTVEVTSAGIQPFQARVASGGDGGSFHLELDGKAITSTVTVPNTSDWSIYQTVSGETESLSVGMHILRFAVDGSYFNIDRIHFGDSTLSILPVQNLKQQGIEKYRIFNIYGKYMGSVVANSPQECLSVIRNSYPMGIYVTRSNKGIQKITVTP